MDFLAANHPKVIHFTIAFLILYILFEILGLIFKKDYLQKSALIILGLGVIAAIGAVLTGRAAEEAFEYFNRESGKILEEHEEYANITLWYFVGVLILRSFLTIKKKLTGIWHVVVVIAAIIGGYFIFLTGEYGGQMVYKHGVGTEFKIKTEEAE